MKQLDILKKAVSSIILFVVFCFTLIIKGQTASNGSSPQFFFSEFDTGSVKMKNGLGQKMRLNFNTVSQKVVYEKEGEIYDLTNIGMIDAVIIHSHMFVPVGMIFHEVLLIAPIPLLVQYKGEIQSPGSNVGYGGKSLISSVETPTSVKLSMGYYNLKLPVEYSVKVEKVYLTRIRGNAYSFINERQFIRLFPEKESELKNFIRQNHTKFDNSTDIMMLLKYCNTLFPPGMRLV